MSVDTRMRCLKSLNDWYILMRSSCFMPAWMATDGKLHSCSSLSSWMARCTDLTNTTTCSTGGSGAAAGAG
eukprot:3160936-Prymnesium_polylepis.1